MPSNPKVAYSHRSVNLTTLDWHGPLKGLLRRQQSLFPRDGITDCFWVAEKSRVCRIGGRFWTMASTAAENPCRSVCNCESNMAVNDSRCAVG